ncbi:MAG: ERF family protein [Aliivibrio sp.]|nr:ERF family protein [Aliivibrio sp.]|tara:strand:- start:101 stop:628 length:528 start_codon:yes stop_codon:yes gene_type:complete
MTINEKLSKIQVEFKSKKSRFNSFGKYHFRSAEDILEATKPFLKELKVTVTVDEELVSFDPPVMQVTATISDGKDTINSKAVVGVDLDQKGMQMPQRYGAASSYGKKYALGNLFLIDDTQDSDATNTHGKATAAKQTMTKESLAKAKEYIAKGGSLNAIKAKYVVTKKHEEMLTL